MTARFRLVRYGSYQYHIATPSIEEVAGHLDVRAIRPMQDYSLHTEYSFGKRQFSNSVFDRLCSLPEATSRGIPLLWHSDRWAQDFFEFIEHLVDRHTSPSVIEVHPPFMDACGDAAAFLRRYRVFDDLVARAYPQAAVLLENRSGSFFRDGFPVETSSDLVGLCEEIKRTGSRLCLTVDVPQLLRTLGAGGHSCRGLAIREALEPLRDHRHLILGVHIWGRDGRAHVGGLDSLFGFDARLKEGSLRFLSEFFDDGRERLLVPEVNGTEQAVFERFLQDLACRFTLT